MRVYELAKELGTTSGELIARLGAQREPKPHHNTSLTERQIALARAAFGRARGARRSSPPPPQGARTRSRKRSRAEHGQAAVRPVAEPPVVGFGSLKGGVGKTTMALCAAELLRRGMTSAGSATWPVVLIDADVAGTEVHWVWNEGCSAAQPGAPSQDAERWGHPLYRVTECLLDLLNEVPDQDGVPAQETAWGRLRTAVDEIVGGERSGPRRGLVMPSFPAAGGVDASVEAWKRELEVTGTYVTATLTQLIERLRKLGCAVVVDLPAFDVGFAHHASASIANVGGRLFLVTDGDLRSLLATDQHLRASTSQPERQAARWRHVVLNRASDSGWRAAFASRLAGAVQRVPVRQAQSAGPLDPPVVALSSPEITDATSLHGGPRLLMDAIHRYLNAPRLLSDADQRRLRGDDDRNDSLDDDGAP